MADPPSPGSVEEEEGDAEPRAIFRKCIGCRKRFPCGDFTARFEFCDYCILKARRRTSFPTTELHVSPPPSI